MQGDVTESAPRDVFLHSLRRCVARDGFISAFYERFLASSEEIKKKFRFTVFEEQNTMLSRSLELCAGATAGDAESLAELNERAKTHDRYHLNIDPQFYSLWLESLIAVARECDSEWTEAIEDAWREVLGFVIAHMIRRY